MVARLIDIAKAASYHNHNNCLRLSSLRLEYAEGFC
jgi:hypothetical protein